MNLCNPDSSLRLFRSGYEGRQQAAEHGAHFVAPARAEPDLGQVTVAVLEELDDVGRRLSAPH